MFCYQFVAHIPKFRKIWAKDKKWLKFNTRQLCPWPFIILPSLPCKCCSPCVASYWLFRMHLCQSHHNLQGLLMNIHNSVMKYAYYIVQQKQQQLQCMRMENCTLYKVRGLRNFWFYSRILIFKPLCWVMMFHFWSFLYVFVAVSDGFVCLLFAKSLQQNVAWIARSAYIGLHQCLHFYKI